VLRFVGGFEDLPLPGHHIHAELAAWWEDLIAHD
jgi:hypothetical protein